MTMKPLAIGFTIYIIVVSIIFGFIYFTQVIPANVEYQNKFGAHVILAVQGQPDFQGIDQQVQIMYRNMNQTFPTSQYNWNTTYNNPWPWGATYDNSLAAQSIYLHHIETRITYYESYVNQSSKLSDVYNQAITNLRNEMNASGGLDWALNGAWYLTFAPIAYWFNIYLLLAIGIPTLLLALYLILSGMIFDW